MAPNTPDPKKIPIPSYENGFVGSGGNEDRFKIVSFWNSIDKHLTMTSTFGPLCQGPPGHAHGGSIAALLDEAMGGSAWLSGYPVVAASFTINLRKMLPLGTTCDAVGWVSEVKGRKVFTKGTLTAKGGETDGTLHADSEGVFVILQKKDLPKGFLEMDSAASAWIQFVKSGKPDFFNK